MPSSVQQTFVGRENGTDTLERAARRLSVKLKLKN